MWKLSAVLVVFFCVSCANNRHEPLKWPVTLVGVEGFSDEQKTRVMDAIDELNGEVRRTVVSPAGTGEGSPVVIRWAKEIPKSASTIAGRAYVSSDDCTIQIADIVAQDPTLLRPVLWHELGHCAGMEHDPLEGEIMFKNTNFIDEYDPSALSRFFTKMQEATGLF